MDSLQRIEVRLKKPSARAIFLRREKSALKRIGTPEFHLGDPDLAFSLLTQSLPGDEQVCAWALGAESKEAQKIPERTSPIDSRMMDKGYGPIFAWTGSARLGYAWLLANDLHLQKVQEKP